MVEASKGYRRGTRRRLKKNFRQKFKSEPYLKEFKPRDRIVIKTNTSSHRSFPHPRFMGAEGEIIAKQGRSYLIKLKIGGKPKLLILSPEHIEKIKKDGE